MKIIRDEEFSGVMMTPLLVNWGIKRCNQKGCTNKPNTVIAELKDVPIFGLCEEHYQMCNTLGGGTLDLEWDDFDAFKQAKEQEQS